MTIFIVLQCCICCWITWSCEWKHHSCLEWLEFQLSQIPRPFLGLFATGSMGEIVKASVACDHEASCQTKSKQANKLCKLFAKKESCSQANCPSSLAFWARFYYFTIAEANERLSKKKQKGRKGAVDCLKQRACLAHVWQRVTEIVWSVAVALCSRPLLLSNGILKAKMLVLRTSSNYRTTKPKSRLWFCACDIQCGLCS